MYHYFVSSGSVLIPTDDWSKVKKDCKIIDATKTEMHLEYPNGIIMDCILTIHGADVTINKELVLNDDGNYEIKEEN